MNTRTAIGIVVLPALGLACWWMLGGHHDETGHLEASREPAKSTGRRSPAPLPPAQSLAEYHRLNDNAAQTGWAVDLNELERVIAGMSLADVRTAARTRLDKFESTREYEAVLLLLLERWAEEEPRPAWELLNEIHDRLLEAEGVSPVAFERLNKFFVGVLRSWARGDAGTALELINDEIEGDVVEHLIAFKALQNNKLPNYLA